MKRLLILTLLVFALTPAATQAHSWDTWYWSEYHAAVWLDREGYTYNSYCEGYGRTYKRNLYRHFDCYDTDGEEYNVHVTGRKWARVY